MSKLALNGGTRSCKMRPRPGDILFQVAGRQFRFPGHGVRGIDRIAELYLSGAVRVPHVALYRLSQAAEALRVSEVRHFKGKLLFKVL